MPAHMQSCLIKGTILMEEEEAIINNLLSNNELKSKKIIIYGLNHSDNTTESKYNQLKAYKIEEIRIYKGGMFEWLCLQEIFGEENFVTTKKELNVLKYS
jgi:hypothetical protein